MPKYVDGTEMKVGDIFSSPRTHGSFSWKIMDIDHENVYWQSVEDSFSGQAGIHGQYGCDGIWTLIRREGPRVFQKSGFGKFIKRIESND